jgi:hypothetical protein
MKDICFLGTTTILFLGICCGQPHTLSDLNDKNKILTIMDSTDIYLETFTDIPQEIDGCACYFFASQENREKSEYIFVNDWALLAFVKINGQLVKFELQEYDEKRMIYYYTHHTDKMRVEITKKIEENYESVVVEGVIRIDTEKWHLQQKFIGDCGC